MDTELNEGHFERAEFFALQTLVKCCVRALGQMSPDQQRFAQEFQKLFASSVEQYRLAGMSREAHEAARNHMLDVGSEWIADALSPQR